MGAGGNGQKMHEATEVRQSCIYHLSFFIVFFTALVCVSVTQIKLD